MATPRIPNQKKLYEALGKRLNGYSLLVKAVYDDAAEKMAGVVALRSTLRFPNSQYNSFDLSLYPALEKEFNAIQSNMASQLRAVILSGTEEEWNRSNAAQDKVAETCLRKYGRRPDRSSPYFQANRDALEAFQMRSRKGLTLSDVVWQHSVDMRGEMGCAIASAIYKGTDAVTLSKQVSRYLSDFDALQKDYTECFGHAADCSNCEYRSIRLARTEINMAYRTAEQERWKQFDFVRGYEIKTTQKETHIPDICDMLAGTYPKDFTWTGWHPNCMCYAVPLLQDEEALLKGDDHEDEVSMPQQFEDWVRDNEERIAQGRKNGTVPYFIKDNEDVVDSILSKKNETESSHSPMTEEQFNMGKSGTPTGKSDFVDRWYDCDYKWLRNSVMGNFNTLEFEEDTSELFKKFGIRGIRETISDLGDGTAYLCFDCDKFTMGRSFYINQDGKREVHHDIFELNKELQGKGISKGLFKELYKQYQACGIEIVTVDANIDVGGYTWARYGFCVKDKADALEAIQFSELSRHEANQVRRVIDNFYYAHPKGTPFPMDNIASLPCGKNALLGGDWEGTIDLANKEQRERWEKYLGM